MAGISNSFSDLQRQLDIRQFGHSLGLVDTIGIEYRVSEKYRDFFSIGIDPSIGVWVSKIDTENALGKLARMIN